MTRPAFPASPQIDRHTLMREGGEVTAALMLRASHRICDAAEQIMVLSHEIDALHGGSQAMAAESMASLVKAMAEKMMSYFDPQGDDYKILDLAHTIFPSFDLAERELEDALNRSDRSPSTGETVEEGAKIFIDLFSTIFEIGEDTCGRLDADHAIDSTDYKIMAGCVSDVVHGVFAPDRSPAVKEGFARALADLLWINASGGGTSHEGWDPIGTTEFSFSGRLDAALRARDAAPIDKQAEGETGELSMAAKAAIEQMALQVRELADIFQADGRLVDLLDHAADLYDKAAATPASEAGYVLVTVESFLQAALMLATHDQQFANPGLAALLTTIVEKADALSNSFDSGGVYTGQKAKAAPAVQSEEVAVAA